MTRRQHKKTKLKSTLVPLICILTAGASPAAILASWDDWTNGIGQDNVMTGFTTTIINTDGMLDRIDPNNGSLDGTFGTLSGADATSTSGLSGHSQRNGPVTVGSSYTFEIDITNSTGVSYTLETLYLDYHGNGGWSVTKIDYQDTGGTVNLATDVAPITNAWVNYDIGIGAQTLADGETGTFIFTLLYENNDRRNARFDNIAITGTAIPEPGVSALIGLSGMLLLARRRR